MTIDLACRYNLTVLPEPIAAPIWSDEPDWRDHRLLNKGTAYIWSGKGSVPAVGERVMITMNGLGPGTVDSYFVEHGFLGIRVKLEADPDWHVRQSKGTSHEGHALVFGTEIE